MSNKQDINSFFIIEKIRDRLTKGLPGLQAQLKLAPLLAGKPYRPFEAPSRAKLSGTLVPLFFDDNTGELSVILTLRSYALNSHRGQISFPGGKLEEGESAVQAALREAYEEIGISPDKIDVLGMLTPLYIPPSNSKMMPVVGFLEKLPEFRVNGAEVEEILFVPLNKLMDKSLLLLEKWDFEGSNIEVPCWRIHNSTPLWGATAMVLNELLEIIPSCSESPF